MFDSLDTKPDFPKIEEDIIAYWKENSIFEKSVNKGRKNKKWTFLDGPPFITGLPHYGSLLSSIPKDLYPRFWTMKGYTVERVWGWDCHGLPAENKVEEKLGITRKRDIEDKIGIKTFIDECKRYVSTVSEDWEWYIDHIARFVDFKNSYRTMDKSYMETVMWVFKELYDKNLIYKGLRVSLYCPHCATPISNFEVAMDADNYKTETDPATIYKYPLVGENNTFVLAWSTTPWNKIVTPALAVNPELNYVKVEQEGERYILAESTLKILKKGAHKVVGKTTGKDLIGKKFTPHYDYYKIGDGKRAFEIICGDFVTAEEGTGVVTIAAYGEEDLKAMKENDIHIELHLDEDGMVKSDVPIFSGMYYLKANKAVNEDLHNRGLIYSNESLSHPVPHCWRCSTRLYYAPQDAWFVDITTLKPKLNESAKIINWFPSHFKEGRFAKSMASAPDWCISRSRYWGSPVPVWECSCGERFVPGSISELEAASGSKIDELHRPEIDEVIVKCKKCGQEVHRVKEVLDSWIEAGSAPYASHHYPFNKESKLEDFFPPDFIVEYTGQIRAWFYVLHVLGTALFNQAAFKNVVVTGVILGTDGRKMSKNFGNYPDPREMLDKYGGDSLRLYLMGSSVMRGEDIIISEEEYRASLRDLLLPYWNITRFFVDSAQFHHWKPDNEKNASDDELDQWILSRMNGSIKQVTQELESFNTPKAVELIKNFVVRDLSMWYLRRAKENLRPEMTDPVIINRTLSTLYQILIEYSKVMAPIIPFLTEAIYRKLTKSESIHLESWPDYENENKALEEEMDWVMKLCSAVHSVRKKNNIAVRIPIRKINYSGPFELTLPFLEIAKSETNIYEILFKKKSEMLELNIDTTEKNLDIEAGKAREIVRSIQQQRHKMGLSIKDIISVTVPDFPEEFKDYIITRTQAKELITGDKLTITVI